MLRLASLLTYYVFVLYASPVEAGRRGRGGEGKQLRLGLQTFRGKAEISVRASASRVTYSVDGWPAGGLAKLGKNTFRAGKVPFEIDTRGKDRFELQIPAWSFSARAHFAEGRLKEIKVYQRVEVKTWRNWLHRVAIPSLHLTRPRRLIAKEAAELNAVRRALERSTVPLEIHKAPLLRQIRPWEHSVYEAGNVRVEVRPGLSLRFERTLIGTDTVTHIFRLPRASSDSEFRVRSSGDD